jgi:uncharacterized protein
MPRVLPKEPVMTIESNKAVVTAFCAAFAKGDPQAIVDFMTDDVNYWILGRRELVRSAGDHTKAEMKRIFEIINERTRQPMTLTPKSMIAEGDEVALEAESYVELKNGRVYNNRYHLRIKLRDGKLASIREYLDTQHVYETWFAEAS